MVLFFVPSETHLWAVITLRQIYKYIFLFFSVIDLIYDFLFQMLIQWDFFSPKLQKQLCSMSPPKRHVPSETFFKKTGCRSKIWINSYVISYKMKIKLQFNVIFSILTRLKLQSLTTSGYLAEHLASDQYKYWSKTPSVGCQVAN